MVSATRPFGCTPNHTKQCFTILHRGFHTFRPIGIREVALPVDSDRAAHVLQGNEPCVFRAGHNTSKSVGDAFMKALRELNRLVPVELGDYASPDLERVSLPITAYIDWIEQGHSTVQGKQLYLAQESSLWQDEPSLQTALPVPSMLQSLISEKRADLYQSALFLGPPGAVCQLFKNVARAQRLIGALSQSSALHYDPTSNLFQIVSAPNKATKAFLVFPPSFRESFHGLKSSNRNSLPLPLSMSLVSSDLQALQCAIAGMEVSEEQKESLSRQAQCCVLEEGDLLYLPPRWWHTVQNFANLQQAPETVMPQYVAGMGWWFHLRAASLDVFPRKQN